MTRPTLFISTLALCLLVVLSLPARAQEAPPAGDALCEDSGIFGPKLFTDICWACLFPIKISGAQITPGKAPDKSSKKIFCVCQEGSSGIYKPGIMTAMWEPARIIEHVRKPGCSPTLGGATLPLGSKRSYGRLNTDHAKRDDVVHGSFYQTHYYAFPLLQILDLYTPTKCNADGYLDVDIISFTEIDPTWNNATLAFFQHPESAAVANPIARAACAVETGVLTAGKEPLESMWWCAGTWGGIYPLTGHVSAQDSNRTSALLTARLLSQQHRRGLARRTMGDENICNAGIYPTIPKSQYKFNQFMPKPMTQKGMWVGEHPYQWDGRSNRHIPGTLNDSMYMIWRWTDCCSKL